MTEPTNLPIIKPEIVGPPSVSNLSVAQVGTGMFSVAMQVIMVVRFPNDAPTEMQMVINADHAVPHTPVTASTTMQAELKYGNGELANAFDRASSRLCPIYQGRSHPMGSTFPGRCINASAADHH
jgi:hypothetical protein